MLINEKIKYLNEETNNIKNNLNNNKLCLSMIKKAKRVIKNCYVKDIYEDLLFDDLLFKQFKLIISSENFNDKVNKCIFFKEIHTYYDEYNGNDWATGEIDLYIYPYINYKELNVFSYPHKILVATKKGNGFYDGVIRKDFLKENNLPSHIKDLVDDYLDKDISF